jgi:hypothetical protein
MTTNDVERVVPKNTFPDFNIHKKRNPIKHWRKQYNFDSNSKQVSIEKDYSVCNDGCGTIEKVYKNVKKPYIRRNGNTRLKQNYHQSYNNYLQKKNKTYESNISKGSIRIAPVYNYANNNECSTGLIYKPNNKDFGTQGAVDSSLRTRKVRHTRERETSRL